MSFRTDMVALENDLTDLLLPENFDQVINQVTIRVRTWAGGYIDAPGGTSDVDLPLLQKCPVRELTTREISNSGGEYTLGDIIVSLIIPADPANPGIGFTPAQLKPDIVSGQELIYIVTGTLAGEYGCQQVLVSDPYEYKLVLTRRATTP